MRRVYVGVYFCSTWWLGSKIAHAANFGLSIGDECAHFIVDGLSLLHQLLLMHFHLRFVFLHFIIFHCGWVKSGILDFIVACVLLAVGQLVAKCSSVGYVVNTCKRVLILVVLLALVYGL